MSWDQKNKLEFNQAENRRKSFPSRGNSTRKALRLELGKFRFLTESLGWGRKSPLCTKPRADSSTQATGRSHAGHTWSAPGESCLCYHGGSVGEVLPPIDFSELHHKPIK